MRIRVTQDFNPDQEETRKGGKTRRSSPEKRTNPALKKGWCLDCNKRGYSTEEQAREAIGAYPKLKTLPGWFACKPYLCHHGWWHFGRRAKTIRIITSFGKPAANERFSPK